MSDRVQSAGGLRQDRFGSRSAAPPNTGVSPNLGGEPRRYFVAFGERFTCPEQPNVAAIAAPPQQIKASTRPRTRQLSRRRHVGLTRSHVRSRSNSLRGSGHDRHPRLFARLGHPTSDVS